VILGLPLLVRGLQAVVFALRGGVFVTPPFVAQPLSLIGLTVMMVFLGPFSEEFGWRGFALDRLLARWSALPFLVVFLRDRNKWGGLIPAYVLFAVAIPFFVVYARNSQQWWALIAGGILAVIGLPFLIAEAAALITDCTIVVEKVEE
jgi:membrane protease YdiL (CAAX protease family)